ncbi:MAG TPA: ABC transporter ATP-binding protein [Polyangiaceae bacterium]|nr:ABC transporter ATP-binding protein [Polyangiaceae bacterium]
MSALTAANNGAVVLRQVDIHFGEGKTAVMALRGLDLEVAPGEFVSVLGPSGCGKSTIIGAVAGFTRVSTGEVLVADQPVRAPGPDRGVVFQQHTLFPWKTVLENVAFGLKMQRLNKRARREAGREVLEQVGLSEFAEHYPHQLSGGMQQRVNLARVLINRPRVILMDEPFCSLDAQTRLQMQQMLLALWHQMHMTVVFVTHDVDEAVFLSDRVVVLTHRPGSVKAELPIPLPRPRTLETLTSGDFTNLKRHALGLLLAESGSKLVSSKGSLPMPDALSVC